MTIFFEAIIVFYSNCPLQPALNRIIEEVFMTYQRRKLLYRLLRQRFHEECRKHNIDPSGKIMAYQRVREMITAEERHLWPENLSVYRKYDDKEFFLSPTEKKPAKAGIVKRKKSIAELIEEFMSASGLKKAIGRLKLKRGRKKTGTSDGVLGAFLPVLRAEFIRYEKLKQTAIGWYQQQISSLEEEKRSLQECLKRAEGIKTEDPFLAKQVESLTKALAIREAELEAARAAIADSEGSGKPESAKPEPKRRRSGSTVFEQIHAPAINPHGNGICTDILSIRDVEPVAKKAEMERRETIYARPNGRFIYSEDIVRRFIRHFGIKNHSDYAQKRVQLIKNPDVLKMYPETLDVYFFSNHSAPKSV